jgi:hypothetical protein
MLFCSTKNRFDTKANRNNTQKLDSSSSITSSNDLSSNEKIFRRNEDFVANGKTQSSRCDGGNKQQKSEKIRSSREEGMNFLMRPQERKIFRIEVPYTRKPGVRYIIRSQFPIVVYLVDYNNFNNFNADQPFAYISGGGNSGYFDQSQDLPYSGAWYLILWNTNNTNSQVDAVIYV